MLNWVPTVYMGNRKFLLENQMVRAILLGPLGRVQKIIYRL